VRVAGDSQQYRWTGQRNLYRDPTKTRVRIPNAFEDRTKLLAWITATETQSRMVALKIGARILERASLTNLVRPKDFQLWGTWSATGTEDGLDDADARTWGAVIEQVGPGGPYADWVGTAAARAWDAARQQTLRPKANE
jgi:hypothetical protein